MSVYIRAGRTRQGFSLIYHEVWDDYHPLIGDKATMYYLFLVRYRNNDASSSTYGKSWRGRKGVVEKFQLGYATLPAIDRILSAAGLVDIERVPSPNGRDKIYYTVHDPLTSEEFAEIRGEYVAKMKEVGEEFRKEFPGLIGKESRGVLLA